MRVILQGAAENPITRAARLGTKLPRAFNRWFVRATAHDPANRFSTVGEQLEALCDVLDVKSQGDEIVRVASQIDFDATVPQSTEEELRPWNIPPPSDPRGLRKKPTVGRGKQRSYAGEDQVATRDDRPPAATRIDGLAPTRAADELAESGSTAPGLGRLPAATRSSPVFPLAHDAVDSALDSAQPSASAPSAPGANAPSSPGRGASSSSGGSAPGSLGTNGSRDSYDSIPPPPASVLATKRTFFLGVLLLVIVSVAVYFLGLWLLGRDRGAAGAGAPGATSNSRSTVPARSTAPAAPKLPSASAVSRSPSATVYTSSRSAPEPTAAATSVGRLPTSASASATATTSASASATAPPDRVR